MSSCVRCAVLCCAACRCVSVCRAFVSVCRVVMMRVPLEERCARPACLAAVRPTQSAADSSVWSFKCRLETSVARQARNWRYRRLASVLLDRGVGGLLPRPPAESLRAPAGACDVTRAGWAALGWPALPRIVLRHARRLRAVCVRRRGSRVSWLQAGSASTWAPPLAVADKGLLNHTLFVFAVRVGC